MNNGTTTRLRGFLHDCDYKSKRLILVFLGFVTILLCLSRSFHENYSILDPTYSKNHGVTKKVIGNLHNVTKLNIPYTFHYKSKGNPDVCKKSNRNNKLLIGIILSIPSNVQHRKKIRDIFAKQMEPLKKGFESIKVVFKLMFVMGESTGPLDAITKAEQTRYGDVIEGKFSDNYKNLPEKSLYYYHWVKYHCQAGDYFLHMDEDVVFNVSLMLKIFQNELPKEQDWLLGRILNGTKPDRNIHSKYGASVQQYPNSTYPDYIDGFAYFLPRSSALKLYEQRLKVPVFYIDDIYTTGICRIRTDVKVIYHKGFCRQHLNVKRREDYCVAYHP